MKNTVTKIVLLVSLLSGFSQVLAQATEDKLKAVFLERFTRFVEWPDPNSQFSDTSRSFVIKVIGTNPFNAALEELYTNTKIKNKKVEIDYISKISDIDSCHILYISGSEEKTLDRILEYTKSKPILTISDQIGFAERGVIINFFVANNKLRFEINESSLIRSKLYMSYLLLNVATIVETMEGNE